MTTMSRDDSRCARLWPSWTLFCAVGEILGMVVAPGCTVFANRLVGEPDSMFERVTVMTVMVGAGAIDGFSSGTFQWRVLYSVFPKLTKTSWLKATVTMAVLGWFFGMLPSTLTTGATTELVQSPNLPSGVVAFWAAVLSVVLGAAFGGSQWVVLRRHAHNAWTWIVANAMSWSIAMVILFLAAAWLTEATAAGIVVLIGALASLLAELSVGAVTGWFLL